MIQQIQLNIVSRRAWNKVLAIVIIIQMGTLNKRTNCLIAYKNKLWWNKEIC